MAQIYKKYIGEPVKFAQTHDVGQNRLFGTMYSSTAFRYARQMSDIYRNAVIDAHKKYF